MSNTDNVMQTQMVPFSGYVQIIKTNCNVLHVKCYGLCVRVCVCYKYKYIQKEPFMASVWIDFQLEKLNISSHKIWEILINESTYFRMDTFSDTIDLQTFFIFHATSVTAIRLIFTARTCYAYVHTSQANLHYCLYWCLHLPAANSFSHSHIKLQTALQPHTRAHTHTHTQSSISGWLTTRTGTLGLILNLTAFFRGGEKKIYQFGCLTSNLQDFL